MQLEERTVNANELEKDILPYHQMPSHRTEGPRPKQEFSPRMANGELCFREEFGTFWLWAYPSLLGWPLDVRWLFSPVVHNRVYPGDLWGVDEVGKLLIVETKLARDARADPFVDFVKLLAHKTAPPALKAANLQGHWEALYEAERDFITRHRESSKRASMTGASHGAGRSPG